MNRVVPLDIVDLAYNGKSVGYLDGKVTFVNGGLPGERVEVRIDKSFRSYNHATLVHILTRSSERVAPICRHYDICGGCTWQDLAYDRQLFHKRNQVIATLKHIGGFDDVPVDEIRPSPQQFFYRNKMEYSFHVLPDAGPDAFVLGLHERGQFDRIFDLKTCHLQSDLSNRLVAFIRRQAADLNISIYDLVRHRGFLRFMIIREGKNTGQVMLSLVSGKGEFPQKERLISAVQTEFPEMTTAVWVVNESVTNIARGELREILFGPGYIEEEILGYRFRISPGSFFQTNSRQTEELYRTAIDLAGVDGDDTVLDLYCGAGTIGLCSAAQAYHVVGIDIDEEAIQTARLNADVNGIGNARFYAGSIREVMLDPKLRDRKFDPAFIDPPRAGMHPKALKRLIEAAPARIIYISCNPATFARDARLLTDAGYGLKRVIPFDMFPHTMHIELVSRFEKKSC